MLLCLAIAAEVFATIMLKVSEGFTRGLPTLGVVLGFGLAFYLESVVLRLGMPVSVTYAVWAGGGIALLAVAGRVLFADPLNLTTVAGIALIALGVFVVQYSLVRTPH